MVTRCPRSGRTLVVMADHEQFEALAVRHVLGGLDAADSIAFRSHLQGCQVCRSRVAELRGIAASLAEVEEDERSRRSLRTELPPQTERCEDEPPPEHEPQGLDVRHVMVGALLVLALAVATAFWNFHLRTVIATAALAADEREETLAGLAEGMPVQADVAAGLQGLVVVGDDHAAFVLGGLGPLGDGERLVARISSGSLVRPQVVRVAGWREFRGGAFSATAATGGAARLTVTREGPQDSSMTLLEAEILQPRPIGASSDDG